MNVITNMYTFVYAHSFKAFAKRANAKSSHERYCSVAIFRIVIFCILGFSKCNSYVIAGNIMYKVYVEIFTYSFVEVINWKENKEVGNICFEVRIPMKKPKIFLEFFYVSFQNKILYLDSTTLFWKKTKMYLETFSFQQKASEQ